MERLITARDYLPRSQSRSVRERIKTLSGRMYRRGILDTPFRDEETAGLPVYAEVNHGQWIAFCECGGAEAVDPDEAIFYCFNCGNRVVGGRPRFVVFPSVEMRVEIERLLMERPVDDCAGANDIDRAFNAKPLAIGAVNGEMVALHRTWKPTETLDDLRRQNGLIKDLVKQFKALKETTNGNNI